MHALQIINLVNSHRVRVCENASDALQSRIHQLDILLEYHFQASGMDVSGDRKSLQYTRKRIISDFDRHCKGDPSTLYWSATSLPLSAALAEKLVGRIISKMW